MSKSDEPEAQPDAAKQDEKKDRKPASDDPQEKVDQDGESHLKDPKVEADDVADTTVEEPTVDASSHEDETQAADLEDINKLPADDESPVDDGEIAAEQAQDNDIPGATDESIETVEEEAAADGGDQQPASIAVAGALPGAALAATGINTETKTEPGAVAQPQTAAQSQARGPGFFPLFLGGLVAAVLGFLAGNSGVLNDYLPESFQQKQIDIAPLEQAQSEQVTAIEGLGERVEALQADVEERLATLQTNMEAVRAATNAEGPEAVIETLSGDIAALTARIETLEARPVAEPPPDNLATTSDVDGLQAALDAQRAEIAALAERAREAEAQAQAEAQAAFAQAALVRVVGAMERGEAYSTALDELQQTTSVEVPDALLASAETGVASLAELQDSFPEAARAALAAARAEVPESEVDGVVGFFRRQLNVRSVVPREGDDADAILSRAEANIRQNALGDALVELDSLPEASKTAMQDWLAMARARLSAQEAAAALADGLTAN